MKNEIIENAKALVEAEANALRCLANLIENELNNTYLACIDLLLNTKGKICLTGIGKSAHIANKISSTLSSTGSPAYFLHPSEASHGDLGTVDKQDVVIALSNSGESQELQDIILYTVRYNIPLIAITKNPQSFLAKNSRFCLTLPNLPEACPLGLAPTNSSTMMLALGDAIAICLIEERGFSSSDFGNFHPGGKLGKQFKCVKEIMHSKDKLPLISKDMLMSEAILVMSNKGFGCLGIIDEGKLIGIISDGDLRRNMNDSLLQKKASEIMSIKPLSIKKDELVLKAISIMNEKKITCLFVLENEQAIGLIHLHDCLML